MPSASSAPPAASGPLLWTRVAVPFLSGVLFAVGLGVAGMTQPLKVIGFLDVAGQWDPSLGFVMGGAVVTYFLLLLVLRRKPVHLADLGPAVRLHIDARLIGGAAIFGVGWGMAGLCPGPAVLTTLTALPGALAFVGAMLVGMLAWRKFLVMRERAHGASEAAALQADAPQENGMPE